METFQIGLLRCRQDVQEHKEVLHLETITLKSIWIYSICNWLKESICHKMPLNKVPRLRDPTNRDCVLQVRDLFIEQYKKEPELYYEEDVQLVKDLKFILQRCLISKRKNVNESLNMLVNMLKWRKELKIRELSDQDFPIEYFTAGIAFVYEPDKYGNKTLYFRTTLLKCVPELRESFKKFVAYLMYQIDDCENGETFSVVFDLTNTGWSNYDIDLLMHFLSLLKDYFAVNVDYILSINFPWVLSAAWSVIKRLIPPERRDVVVFISDKDVLNYVDKQNLPDFLGGTCKREYQMRPKTYLTVADYLLSQSEPALSAKRIADIIKTLSDLLTQEQVTNAFKQIEESGRR